MVTIPHMATIKETAKETGLAEYHIRQLCLNREIIAVQTGRKWLVNVDRLVDYLNQPGERVNEQTNNQIRRNKIV